MRKPLLIIFLLPYSLLSSIPLQQEASRELSPHSLLNPLPAGLCPHSPAKPSHQDPRGPEQCYMARLMLHSQLLPLASRFVTPDGSFLLETLSAPGFQVAPPLGSPPSSLAKLSAPPQFPGLSFSHGRSSSKCPHPLWVFKDALCAHLSLGLSHDLTPIYNCPHQVSSGLSNGCLKLECVQN